MDAFVLLGVAIVIGDGPGEAGPSQAENGPTCRVAKNAVYAELGGGALAYSLNYERFVADDLSVRVGLSYFSVVTKSSQGTGTAMAFLAPVTVSFLGVRSGPHALEVGGGLVRWVPTDATRRMTTGTLIAGYRYAPLDGGFTFRAALTPMFGPDGSNWKMEVWAGVAAGAIF